jgi:peptidoglycan/xylan/chitin deacetylase (PgdA/CDA1 family)
MIILRDDDVLKPTRTAKIQGKEFQRYKFVNEMCNTTNRQLVHEPTILCTEIMDYPEAIEYTRDEWKAGRMQPQLHGWEHKDYVHKSKTEIQDMIKKSQDWFDKHLHQQFDRWATPWGGDTILAREAAQELGVYLESTCGLFQCGGIIELLKQNPKDPSLRGAKILFHWWNKGQNFGRLAEILKHGSYEKAKEADERGWF